MVWRRQIRIFKNVKFYFVSYIVAFSLDGLYRLREVLLRKIGYAKQIENNIYISDDLVDVVCNDFLRTQSQINIINMLNYTFPSISIMYDSLRLEDKDLGGRLVKLLAAVKMCNLLRGCILLL